MSNLTKKWLIVLGSGLLVYLIPVPAGVKPIAWNLLAIFVAIIVDCIIQPIPLGAISVASLSLVGFLGLANINELLAGFANSTIWLIMSAFLLSRGFSKTGLGRRTSYLLIKGFGSKTLNLGFAIMLSEYVFSPATPSTTTRGGAIVYPLPEAWLAHSDRNRGRRRENRRVSDAGRFPVKLRERQSVLDSDDRESHDGSVR